MAIQATDRLLTVPDVAATLQVSVRKTRDLTRSGQLKTVRVGRLVRVTRDAVAAYIAEHQA